MSDLWFQFPLGEFTITIIHDQPATKHPARHIFSHVPEADLNRLNIAHNIVLAHTLMLVQTPSQNILLGAGWGTAQPDREGRAAAVLAQLGIAPDAIDVVLLTHAHPDHYAGMLTPTGEKIYPQARYLMWHDEWAYYTSRDALQALAARDADRCALVERHLLPLAPHLNFLNANHLMIVPGITALPAPGHTKHHIALKINSARKTLIAAADAFIHPLQLNHTDWHWLDDFDPVLLRRSREALLGLARDTDALLAAHHFPASGVGRLYPRGNILVWEPLK